MSPKKIIAVCLVFALSYSTTGAFSLLPTEKTSDVAKASYVKNIFNIALRATPGYDGEKTYLVERGVGGEVIGDSVQVDGTDWIEVQYTPEISGWVRSKLVVKEDYYVLSSGTYTVFLKERTSLAGTSQDVCTTDTAVTASNILTTFRPETPVFTYTPSEVTTGSGEEVTTSYQEKVLTTFRPETPVFSYTPVSTIDSGSTDTQTSFLESVVTSFRPEVPIFKYIVDTAVSTSIDNPIVQTVANMILTSFRPETPVFSYTPSTTVSSGSEEIVTTTSENVLTSFRPETPVFSYTPSTTVSSGSEEIVTTTSENVLTSFRPETPVFSYTPTEFSYKCESVK